MPFSGPSDSKLPNNVKVLPVADRRRWVAVWNSSYAACQRDNGEDCEATAFRQANGVLKRDAAEAGAFDSMKAFLRRLYSALRAKIADGDLSSDDFDQAVRVARAHAGGKARAEKARSAAEGDEPHTSLTVGLWLTEDAAAMLALDGFESAEELHLTLCWCGPVADLGEMVQARVLVATERIAREMPPLVGRVSGLGRFLADPADPLALDVFYASADVPGLAALREQLAGALAACGAPASSEHGFDPHITLAYLEPGAPAPVDSLPQVSLRFDALSISLGDKRIALPLSRQIGYGQTYSTVVGEGQRGPRLFYELAEFAEPPAWVPVLPVPGSYKHPKYGEIALTKQRNGRFVDGFNAGVYQAQVPIDAEHETKVSGALGWIKRLRVNPDGSVDGQAEWTDRGEQMVEEDRFKYVSPEWYDEWTDPATGTTHHDVLIGLALTTRPFFKEDVLRPLAAGESTQEGMPVAEQTSQPVGMTEEQARTFVEMQTRLTGLEQERDAARKAAEDATAAARQAGERVATIERQARHKRFTDEVTGRGDASGARWFGEPAPHVSVLETLADTFGEDSAQFRAYVTQQRATAEALRQSAVFTEFGSDASGGEQSAWGQIQAKAKSLRERDASLSEAAAIAQVAELEPRLYREYVAEQRGEVR